MTAAEVPRFRFGRNWRKYADRHLSEERVRIAQEHFLGFLQRRDLAGLRMVDIGCGSGIHSLGAWHAGVGELVSFDYDPESVETTRRLRAGAGAPANWRVERGSVLDASYLAALGQFDLVYAWGVLHHTGELWTAFRNAAALMKPGGLFYVALYAAEAFKDGTPEFWLEVKRRYNTSGWLCQRLLELWYMADQLQGVRRGGVSVIRYLRDYKRLRGMSYYTNVKDWVGGWPMEFSTAPQVKACAADLGLALVNIAEGEANTEYLFAHRPAAAADG